MAANNAVSPENTPSLKQADDMTAVDIYANDKLVVSGLTYREMTDYFMVVPCDYCIKVYMSGMCKCLLAEACLALSAGCVITVALICPQPEMRLLAIPEVRDVYRNMSKPYQAAIRFVNLSPDAMALEVLWLDGTRLFQGVAFTEHSRYARVDPGTYAFRLRPSGSNVPGVVTPEYTLQRGTVYTLYAVGLVDELPPLETVISTDGMY
jgi:hypothetical protein